MSTPGLVLALVLVAACYAVTGLVARDFRPGTQPTLGVGLNAGVVAALSLLPSRRWLPAFLLVVGIASVMIWRPTDPETLVFALMITAANLPSIVVFRVLALRYAAGGRRLDSHRRLLALLGCGVAAAAVNGVGVAALLAMAVDATWIPAAAVPSNGFLFGTRLVAQCDGIVTITPMVLVLMRRRPGSWPASAWAEIGAWAALMISVSGISLQAPGAAPAVPLLLLVAFSGLVFAVLRLGSLAAAVLTPAFAVSAATVMASGTPVARASGPWPTSVLPSQLAGFIAAILAWAVAATVAEREAARRLAHSEAAAQEALTTLQRALLPGNVLSRREVMVASRYRAAGSHDRIGGDWYDTIALPAGGTALVIGDVEGHDLTAASVMGLVRGAVRSYALEGHPPSIVLERVGAFLLSAGTDRLVTMAYVQLYPEATVATVAVAGHPAPIVVPPDGPATVLPVRGGPILGVEGLTGWEERTVCVPRGAGLVLYTDGLLDFPAAASDQQDRLVALATGVGQGSVDLIADTLISTATPYDDAALLVARLMSRAVVPLERTFPAQSISARIARGWLSDLFGIWQASGVLPDGAAVSDQLEKARLLLTELVANAVRHGDHSFTVRLHLLGQRLRVGVADNSERMPVLRQPEDAATEGRGLRLVDALASAWGVHLDERGKVVWFELDLQCGGDVDEEELLAAFAPRDQP